MIVTNALLGGLAAVQLALLLRRISTLALTQCVVISGFVSLMPAALSASAHVWAEPLLSVLFLATLSTSITATTAASPHRWYLPIGTATLGYLTHGRMLPMLPVVVALAVMSGVRLRRWRHVPVYLVVGAAGYAGVRSFSAFVFSHVWEAQLDENTVANTLGRAWHVGPLLDSLAGQVWYQLVSTALLVALGLIVLAKAAARRSSDPELSPTAARVTLALLTPLVLSSVVFMSDRARPDHLVYGRYNDAVLPIVVALGAGWLVRTMQTGTLRSVVRPLALSALVAAQLGFFIWQYHAKQIENSEAIKPMIAGVAPALGTATKLLVLRATCVALLTIVVLLVAAWQSRSRTLPIALVSAVLLVVSGLAAHHSVEPTRNELESASAVTQIRNTLSGDEVGVALVPSFAEPSVAPIYQVAFTLTYEWYIPEMTVNLDLGLDDEVGPYVFSPDNVLLLPPRGGVIVWEDPERKMALWREPEG